MEVQEIDVFIDRNGEVRVEVRGVKGPGCLDLTQGLERALGGEIAAREMTPEAGQGDAQQTQDRQWQGSG